MNHPIIELPQVIMDAFKIQKIFAPICEKEQIVSGGRNARLASMAGAMRRQGMTAEQILPSLRTVNNQKCNPPLSDGEVQSIANSIGRYIPNIFGEKLSGEKLSGEKLSEESLKLKTRQIIGSIKIIHDEFEAMGCNNDFWDRAKKTIPKLTEELMLAGENIDNKFQIYKENGDFTIVEFAIKQYRNAWSKLLSAS